MFSQKLIDEILPTANYKHLTLALIFVTFLLICKSILNYVRGAFLIDQNKDFNIRVIDGFYGSLLKLPKQFFDTRKTGELITRMNDMQRIQSVINSLIGSTFIDSIVSVTALCMIFYYSSTLGLIFLIAIIVYSFITFLFHSNILSAQRGVMKSYALNESNYIDTIQGIEAIKSNNRESFYLNNTKSFYVFFLDAMVRLGKVNIRFGFWTELIGILLLTSMFALTSFAVLHKELLVGEMVAVIALAGSIVPAINRIALFNIKMQEARVAFDRMYEFVSMKPEYAGENSEKQILNSFQVLKIFNLDFRFPGHKRLLKSVSFKVHKNEFVALLGESGQGKSTILQLLQKFYQPERPESIQINGRLLEDVNTMIWRQHIAVVPQQVKLFNSSLLENICLSNSEEGLKKAREICELYGFSKFFNKFPQGYSTLLGEEGVNISGGQQQLVAVARALYKQPQLLLLDEATAAMDRNTENFILELLLSLKNKMAIIMVTHRIKTASRADNIYILENGMIAANGTPQELMLFDNFYSECYKDIVSY